jgi:hypothetical protein
MVGLAGLEPATSSLSVTRSNQLSYKPLIIPAYGNRCGGDEESRTPDFLLAKQAL